MVCALWKRQFDQSSKSDVIMTYHVHRFCQNIISPLLYYAIC